MVKDFDAEIAEHQRAIKELDAERAAFGAMTEDQQLAMSLHDAFCRWNHTDGCGWFYEVHKGIDDWDGHSHARWLTNVKAVRAQLPADYTNETIIKVVRSVRNLG